MALYDQDDNPVGLVHCNPVLDTFVDEVSFTDVRTQELAVSAITKALYAQCDANGNEYVLLDVMLDCHENVSITWNDQVKMVNGKKIDSCSTHGLELCCEGKDDSAS
jgi:hypothetical protein